MNLRFQHCVPAYISRQFLSFPLSEVQSVLSGVFR